MSLTSKAYFKIGTSASATGTEFLAKSINPSFDSLTSENSGRTDDGVMHIIWVKPKLRKWEITMPPLSSSECSTLLNLIQGKSYYITIWDISTNTESTVHCYTSNSQAECYSGVLHGGFWTGLTFSAIEVGD